MVLNATAPSVDIFLQQQRMQASDPYFVSPPSLSLSIPGSLGNPVQVAVTDLPPADGKLDIVAACSSGLLFLQNASK
jgi:hypothetical protein